MLDRLSRPLRDLRISVTDRCNLRCPYCMPREVFGADHQFLAAEETCSFEEITRLCRLFAEFGVEKLRITGGEPLMRPELERLVAMVSQIPGIRDVALTTNGMLLAAKAAPLRAAGLDRVTVSLDSLDEEVFRTMGDTKLGLGRVLGGIEAALEAGLAPVKINMVVRRGVNHHCILAMAEHFRHRPEILRFIEYMDVGNTNGWRPPEVVPAAEILRAIDERWALEPLAPSTPGEVARRYRYRDGAGELGFISSVSQPFCSACTRARLAADGTLYTCLFATGGENLLALMREGAGDDQLRGRLSTIWRRREDRYSAVRAGLLEDAPSDTPKIEMSYIGG